VPDDPYFAVELRRYFPDGVRVGYPDAVDSHRLRREIIATGLANAVINRTGPSVAVRMAEDTGRPVADVARAYALTRDAFGVLDVNTAIDALDAKISGKLQMELYGAVQQFTTDRMMWFMRHVDFAPGLAVLVERFKVGVGMPLPEGENAWLAKGVPAELAGQMQRLAAAVAVPDATLVAERAKASAVDAMQTLAALANTLDVSRLRHAAGMVVTTDSYERQAIVRAMDGVDSALRSLAVEALRDGGTGDVGVALWAKKRESDLSRAQRTTREMLAGPPSLAKVSVAAGALRDLSRA
jgi:glutamate dehydrogenase